jgi:uncharacterized protein (TIGR00304 family)
MDMNMQFLIGIGISLIILGFLMVIAGAFLSGISEKSELKGGAIIFIGPIPVAFGTDRNSLLIISAMMIVLMVAAYLIFRR